MKRTSLMAGLDALTVLIPGALGLFIVGRTLATYWQRDMVASAIVAAMAVALACGLVELPFRQRRAAQLEREVRGLPVTPSEATVDGASPLLSALLRARLEQAPTPALGESIAPSLTGLLVMLGLLGTLLGLFETVHGASHALAISSDMAALRRSLTTPIGGLTRSFGCSAAGISASAMLGLAVAFVRRREGRALRAVQTYAAGPLRVLSPARRQARALEQLAHQGLALPEASGALDQVRRQLSELGDCLVGLQQSGIEAQSRVVGELVAGLQGELAKGAAEAGAALHDRLAPLIGDAVARSGDALAQQAHALAQASGEITRGLAESAESARREASALVAALGERITQLESARSEAHQKELSSLHELTARSLAQVEARDRQLEARWSALSDKLEQAEQSARNDQLAQLQRFDAMAHKLGADFEQLTQRLGERAAEAGAALHDRLAPLIGDAVARSGDALAQQAHALAQASGEITRGLAESAESARREASELVAALGERITQLESARSEAHQKELSSLHELTARSLAQVEARDRQLEARWSALSDKLEQAEQSARNDQLAQLQRFDAMAHKLGADFEQLTQRLGERAAEAGAALHDRLAPLIGDAVARSGDALAQQAHALAQASGEITRGLAESAESARREASALVAALGERITQLESARSEAHQKELSSLHELTARSLAQVEARDRQLEARWSALSDKLEQAEQSARNDQLAQLQRFDAMAHKLGADFEQLTQRLGEQAAQGHEREQALEQRGQERMAQLACAANDFDASIARQHARSEELLARLPALFAELAQSAHASTRLALGQLLEGTDERLARLTDATDARLTQLSSLLAGELEQRLQDERAHEQSAQRAMAQLEQLAALLESEVARQRTGHEQLAERLGQMFAELGASAQRAAAETFARVQESAAQQSARFAQLEAALERARSEYTGALGERLNSHAEALASKLGDASAVVQEAATAWKVSTVEMQAVAELFASSVQRQREASDAWLESLGEIEGAVDRAGRSAAADALSDQLASTQEVFARQLQFQRELFEQLRTLRTSSARNGSGEHDVSV